MPHAIQAGTFGGVGALATGLGLEGVLSYTLKTQTLIDAYLTKASSVNAGTVNDAYQFADSMLKGSPLPVVSLVFGSLCLGIAAYNLVKSYERKE